MLPLPQLSKAESHGVSFLTDEALASLFGLRIAFTQRQGGTSSEPYASLNLASHVGDQMEAVYANRHRLLEALGMLAYEGALLNPEQVHGDAVCVVRDAGDKVAYQEASFGADGVVCMAKGVPVLLCFADCVPVIMAAPGGFFAIAHAGWRGALAGIAGKTAAVLCGQVGCTADALNIYIGPHICPQCYEVSDEVLEWFTARYGSSCAAGGNHLSLEAALRADLVCGGAAEGRIVSSGLCTKTGIEDFYSYRGEGGVCGRHGGLACRFGDDQAYDG